MTTTWMVSAAGERRGMGVWLRGVRKRAARGFTLIELMIVLAIVGVIAAYAIPAYQDYLAHSRVGEGMALGASAGLAVAENSSSGADLASGYASPPGTRNVESIHVDSDTGQITVALYDARRAGGIEHARARAVRARHRGHTDRARSARTRIDSGGHLDLGMLRGRQGGIVAAGTGRGTDSHRLGHACSQSCVARVPHVTITR